MGTVAATAGSLGNHTAAAGGPGVDQVRRADPGDRPRAVGEEPDRQRRSVANVAGGHATGTGLHRPAAVDAGELVAGAVRRQAADRLGAAGGGGGPRWLQSGGPKPEGSRPLDG